MCTYRVELSECTRLWYLSSQYPPPSPLSNSSSSVPVAVRSGLSANAKSRKRLSSQLQVQGNTSEEIYRKEKQGVKPTLQDVFLRDTMLLS